MNSSGTSSEMDASSPEASSPQQIPWSGLSALIQAATSQLGELADIASYQSKIPPINISGDTFPDILFRLCSNSENLDVIAFLPDGKFFAIRRNKFLDKLQEFEVETFDGFLELSDQFGFTRVNDGDIYVFRHPSFVQNSHEDLKHIRYGETPERAKLQTLKSDEVSTKRRLSPGYLSRRGSLNSVNSKAKAEDDCFPLLNDTGSGDDDPDPCEPVDLRNLATSITKEKLKIRQDSNDLVETAVTSATQEIVTDAIHSLLHDMNHSQQTYKRHERELSKSSIPGVVPVCKQIFSQDGQVVSSPNTTNTAAASATPPEEPSYSRVVTTDSGTTVVPDPGAAKEEEEASLLIKDDDDNNNIATRDALRGSKVLQDSSNGVSP